MNSRLPILVALGLAGALLFTMARARSESPQKPVKIGVVDLRTLMDNCQLRKDKEVEINKMKDAEADKLKEERKVLDGMKSEIDLLAKDSPELPAKNKAYARKQEELMLKNRWAEADVMELWEKTFQSVYSDVLRMIEDFRAKNDYDVIFRYDSQPLGAGGVRVIDQLDRKIIMARAASVDVTEALIKYINETYGQEKKK